MLFGVSTVLTRHIVPFIWLKDLMWQCGVQGRGRAEGRGGGGIRYVVICCCAVVVKCIVARGGWLPGYPISCQFRDL